MTDVETPIGALRSALEIAEFGGLGHGRESPQGFRDIARLIRHALEQLGEPNLASIQAAATMLREAPTDQPEYRELFQRYARDTVAVILKAAVTGEIPEMWSEP